MAQHDLMTQSLQELSVDRLFSLGDVEEDVIVGHLDLLCPQT
jgi:hypothetical protein